MTKKAAAKKPESTLETVLRAAIDASGLTPYALAKLTDGQLDNKRISSFARGESGLTLHAAGVLCDVLGVRIVAPRPKAKQ